MGQITYRAARVADAATIAAIHIASWRDAYADIFDPDYLAGPIEGDRRTQLNHPARGSAQDHAA